MLCGEDRVEWWSVEETSEAAGDTDSEKSQGRRPWLLRLALGGGTFPGRSGYCWTGGRGAGREHPPWRRSVKGECYLDRILLSSHPLRLPDCRLDAFSARIFLIAARWRGFSPRMVPMYLPCSFKAARRAPLSFDRRRAGVRGDGSV